MVERYLGRGNPRFGFARIRCPGCGDEMLLKFSCLARAILGQVFTNHLYI